MHGAPAFLHLGPAAAFLGTPPRLFTLSDPVARFSFLLRRADVGSRFHARQREERRRNALKYVDTVQKAAVFFFHSVTFQKEGMKRKSCRRVVQTTPAH